MQAKFWRVRDPKVRDRDLGPRDRDFCLSIPDETKTFMGLETWSRDRYHIRACVCVRYMCDNCVCLAFVHATSSLSWRSCRYLHGIIIIIIIFYLLTCHVMQWHKRNYETILSGTTLTTRRRINCPRNKIQKKQTGIITRPAIRHQVTTSVHENLTL